MVFRRLHLGTVAYGMDSMDEVQSHVFSAYTQVKKKICSCLSKRTNDSKMNKFPTKHLENKQTEKKRNSKISWKGKTNRPEHCFKKHISVWLLFGWMLPDLRWHSLSPLTPEVSEAGNRISPQAKHWPDFLNDATINPWNAQPSKNSKAIMQKQIVHIYFTHLVMFTGHSLSQKSLKLLLVKQLVPQTKSCSS